MRGRVRERVGGRGGREGKGRKGLDVVHCGYATRFTSAEVDDAWQKRMMHEEKDDEMHIAGGGE